LDESFSLGEFSKHSRYSTPSNYANVEVTLKI